MIAGERLGGALQLGPRMRVRPSCMPSEVARGGITLYIITD
jgi:hypothetical protein